MTDIANLNKLHNPKRQRGLSLVELMISLVISLILLAGLSGLVVQQSQTSDELEKSSRQIENGRYATQILHEDIQHAGFYGQYFILPAPPALVPDPCVTDIASLTSAMPLAIQGYDSPLTSPISCLASANLLPGTDILVVRRSGTDNINFNTATPPVTLTNLLSGKVYLQTNTAAAVLGVGANVPGDTTGFPLSYDTPNTVHAPLRSYLVHIYFVSPCSTMANGTTCTASDDNGRPIPTLKLLALSAVGGATQFTITPLVEGIENMQLEYGLDTDPVGGGDGYPDSYVTAPANTTAWSNVMAVRVNLLARNNEPTPGYSDIKTYQLGAGVTVGPFSEDPVAQRSPACVSAAGVAGTGSYPQRCNYKRHTFSELVRAVNPSGRRAAQ